MVLELSNRIGSIMVRYAAAACFTLLACNFAVAQESKAQQLIQQFQPMLKKHCIDCHSGSEPDAGVTLDHFNKPVDFLKGRKLWDRCLQRVQLKEMPPPESSEMSDEDRAKFQQLVNDIIEDYQCGLTPNPGQVTLRRLNATEYRNTVKELLQIDYALAASFPGDDVGYGFDNIGDVLTLPPLLMEKYFIAAEELSRQVFLTPPGGEKFLAAHSGSQLQGDGGGNSSRTVASEGTAFFNEQLPWGGPFNLKVTLSGDQAGDQPVMAAIFVGDKQVSKLTVPNDRDKPKTYNVDLKLKKGATKIGIRFLNDFYVAAANGQQAQDRNLNIHHVELSSIKHCWKQSRKRKMKKQPSTRCYR
jgi:Protein of unknown function (DUF1587)/Ca-dependent carbohydrate-binding module xylan-binding/Planctomycete cytochrome C